MVLLVTYSGDATLVISEKEMGILELFTHTHTTFTVTGFWIGVLMAFTRTWFWFDLGFT